jgi:hypothetical protein
MKKLLDLSIYKAVPNDKETRNYIMPNQFATVKNVRSSINGRIQSLCASLE